MLRMVFTVAAFCVCFFMVVAVPIGCAIDRKVMTPREVMCRAECTPDVQYIECTGQSEGSETHSAEMNTP